MKELQASDVVHLRHVGTEHETTATISARAAAVRSLAVDGIALVEPTAQVPDLPGMAGAVLAPWPNRVEDGTWWYDGQRLQLPVNEPELGNAIHGLLAQTDFAVHARSASSVELRTTIDPQPGYPFALEVRVGYSLHPDGLSARVDVANRGTRAAPVAVGVHPYLRLGDTPLDDLRVSIDADRAWLLDERNLPGAPRDVRGAAEDFRAPHPVDDLPAHALYRRMDAASRGLVHRLSAEDGRAVELWADPTLPWTQWYVAPDLMTDDGPRRTVAVEPMSAPPNALRSGVDLFRLPPNGSRTWRWAIRLRQPESLAR